MNNITGSDLYGLELRLKQNDDEIKVLKWSRFRVKNIYKKISSTLCSFQILIGLTLFPQKPISKNKLQNCF